MILNEDAPVVAGASRRAGVSPAPQTAHHNHASISGAASPRGLAVRQNTLAHNIALKQQKAANATPSSPAALKSPSSPALHREGDQEQQRQTTFEKEDITLEELRKLKEVFDSAAEGGDGQLDEEQFLTAFGPILGGSMSRDQLRLWFMRIDASANGSVDWDEFSTFLLTTGERNDPQQALTADGDTTIIVKDPKVVPVPPTECSATPVSGHNHSDVVSSIYCHPRLSRYYTGSQDGTVRVWKSDSLEFERILHNSKTWVTSMAPMRDDTKLCVASVDRIISIYDLTHGDRLFRSFVGNTTATEKYSVTRPRGLLRHEIDARHISTVSASHGGGAGSAVESLETFRLRQDRIRLKEAPPPKVDLHILRQMDAPAMAMTTHHSVPDTLFLGLSDGRVQAYDVLGAGNDELLDALLNIAVHDGLTTTLTWVDSLYGFFTTGADGKIFTVNVDRGEARRVNERQRDLHPIHSACWVESARLLATCGTERHVSLWSASSQSPPIYLGGHLSNVTHVVAADNENLLMSMDVEKCIRVWDLRTLRPLQSCVDYDIYSPNNRLTAMCFDKARSTLVTASTAPVVWPLSKMMVPFPDSSYKGHQRSVLTILYNPMFHQFVTADAEVIKIWAAESGQLTSVLTVETLLSSVDLKVDEDQRHRINVCAVVTDNTHRRLFVALTNGIVLIINFANGQVLREMIPVPADTDTATANNMLQQALSVAECSFLEHFGAGVKKYVAVIRGSDILIWEDDPDAGFTMRLQESVRVGLAQEKYAELYYLHRQMYPPDIALWRNPLPICTAGVPPSHLAVGTDAGLTLIYGSNSFEVLAIFGTYEPNTTITTLLFHEETGLLAAGRSDGKVCLYSLSHKDRAAELSHKRRGGQIPNIQSMAMSPDGQTLVVGDDEGLVYIWSLSHLSFPSIPAFGVAVAAIGYGAPDARCVGIIQAHTAEITRVCFAHDADLGFDFIATSSADYQARIVTLRGQLVGYCGAAAGWDPRKPLCTEQELDSVPLMNRLLKLISITEGHAKSPADGGESSEIASAAATFNGNTSSGGLGLLEEALAQHQQTNSETEQPADIFFSSTDDAAHEIIDDPFLATAAAAHSREAEGGDGEAAFSLHAVARHRTALTMQRLMRDLAPTPNTLSPRYESLLPHPPSTAQKLAKQKSAALLMRSPLQLVQTSPEPLTNGTASGPDGRSGSPRTAVGSPRAGSESPRSPLGSGGTVSPQAASGTRSRPPGREGRRSRQLTRSPPGVASSAATANTASHRSFVAAPPPARPSANAMIPPSSASVASINEFRGTARRMGNQRVRLHKKRRFPAELGESSTELLNGSALASALGHSRLSVGSGADAAPSSNASKQGGTLTGVLSPPGSVVALPSVLRVHGDQRQESGSRRAAANGTNTSSVMAPPPPLPLRDVEVPLPPSLRRPTAAPHLPPIVPRLALEQDTATPILAAKMREGGGAALKQSSTTTRRTATGTTEFGTATPFTARGRSPPSVSPPGGAPLPLSARERVKQLYQQYHHGSGDGYADGTQSARKPSSSPTRPPLPDVVVANTALTSRIDVWRVSRTKQQLRQKEAEDFDPDRAASRLRVKELDPKIAKMLNDKRRTYFEKPSVTAL